MGGNVYEQKESVCSILYYGGDLFFAIPIVYEYTGSKETDKLTQEFEQILEEKQKDETEKEETREDKAKAAGRSEDTDIFAEGMLLPFWRWRAWIFAIWWWKAVHPLT